MDAIDHLQTVVLPTGDKVKISPIPEPWWTQATMSGYVSPSLIAPDPKNPRRYMSKDELEELRDSIRTLGVRQPLILTPRSCAPWAKVDPKYEHCFFLAVSGHRRNECALSVGVGAVPVQIAIYPSEKEHRLDMSVFNYGRAPLTHLDQGYEIVNLRNLGWTIEELCKSFGHKSAPPLYMRINLTQLCPELQAKLDPELPKEKQLGSTVGGALGGLKSPTADEIEELFQAFEDVVPREAVTDRQLLEDESEDNLRFLLQKLLFEVIVRRGLGSVRALEFIRERSLKLEAVKSAPGKKTERFQPRRRKDLMESLVTGVEESLVHDWPQSEFSRIFELSSYEEVSAWVERMKAASLLFKGLEDVMKKILAGKKPSRPEVVQLMNRAAAR
jgi:hypothetical protein